MRHLDIIRHLVIKISNDDENAFTQLFELYFSKIYKFTGYFTKWEEARQEIVSDVFITLWKNRIKLQDVNNFESYSFILTKNKSLDYLDKYSEKPTYPLDIALEFHNHYETPEGKILTKELEKFISKSINELPERCKLIFKMTRDEGLSYREIAEILSISEKTVNAQMVTAIKKLGHTLRKYLSMFF